MTAVANGLGAGELAGVLVVAAVALAGAVHRPGLHPRPLPSHAGPRPGRTGRCGGQDPVGRVGRLLTAVGAATLASLVTGPILVLTVAGVAGTAVVTRRRRAGTARLRAIEAAMPDATELLVACLHAGRSPTQALAELARLAPAPMQPAFAAVEQRLHRGHGVADALGELTTCCGRCALPLVTAMSAAVRDGLPLAPVLDRLTDDANASRRRHGEAAARRLPVRLSFPLVVCTLPAFVLLSVAPAVLGALSSLRDSPL